MKVIQYPNKFYKDDCCDKPRPVFFYIWNRSISNAVYFTRGSYRAYILSGKSEYVDDHSLKLLCGLSKDEFLSAFGIRIDNNSVSIHRNVTWIQGQKKNTAYLFNPYSEILIPIIQSNDEKNTFWRKLGHKLETYKNNLLKCPEFLHLVDDKFFVRITWRQEDRLSKHLPLLMTFCIVTQVHMEQGDRFIPIPLDDADVKFMANYIPDLAIYGTQGQKSASHFEVVKKNNEIYMEHRFKQTI